MTGPLLAARQLVREYRVGRRATIRPLDGIDIDVMEGETLGLVGESGSGKSTLGRTLIYAESPSSGSISYRGRPLLDNRGRLPRATRSELQMIFQDPYSSLNPRWRGEAIVGEGLALQTDLRGQQRRDRVHEVFERVGLPASAATKYPHEFSGGQRQRLGIARALVVQPRLVVADEPVSALDLSVQSKILNLLQELKAELGLTYVFISHDLAVVRHVSDRVAVMYLGRIVEVASAADIYAGSLHPYTLSLLSAVPAPRAEAVSPSGRPRIVLHGDPPSLLQVPSGCRFRTRCPFAQPERCSTEVPALRQIAPSRSVACHWAEDISAGRIFPRVVGSDEAITH